VEFAFIVDPLDSLRAYKDSSVSMMRAAQARGHTLFALEQSDVFWQDGITCARVRALTVTPDNHEWYGMGEPLVRPLSSFSAVLMRKDPPFDMEYVYSTYVLEAAEREGARVYNRPRAIRDHNEKMAIAQFREFTAPTLVTRDAELLNEFIDTHEDVILKPLDGMGGASIFRVREADPNRNVIIETVGTGQEAMPFQKNEIVDQMVLVMNPDYGSRLQLQKIVMLDLADIVVVNKSDLQRAKTAHTEIEQRLEQNRRDQRLIDTVAKRHRDPGVDRLFDLVLGKTQQRRKR